MNKHPRLYRRGRCSSCRVTDGLTARGMCVQCHRRGEAPRPTREKPRQLPGGHGYDLLTLADGDDLTAERERRAAVYAEHVERYGEIRWGDVLPTPTPTPAAKRLLSLADAGDDDTDD